MLPSEEIKERLNIVDLIGEYVQLKKAGVNYRGLCPFHKEKSASFTISPAKQIWHCFGCGLGGDVFEFVKQIEGVEFPEALHILATRAGVELKRPTIEYKKEIDQKKVLLEINDWAAKYFAKVLLDSSVADEARKYLQKRGFQPETIRKWGIGYAPDGFHTFEEFIVKKGYQKQEAVAAGLLVRKEDGTFFDRFRGRIMFPLFDIHGRVVGFTGRLIVEQEGVGKYMNSPETAVYNKSQLIYGLHVAKTFVRKFDQVIVVEGNVDVITCHEAASTGEEAGFSNVVGSSGTAFTEKQLLTLQRFTENIAFAFDTDQAGLTATRRAVELALATGFNVKIIAIPKSLAKDPDELIRKDPKLWEEQVRSAQNYLDFYFLAIFATIDLTDSQEKKQAVRDLLPLIALLPNPIDRSHYVKKLSDQIQVTESLMTDLLNRLAAKKTSTKISTSQILPQNRSTRSRQEILEERVMGFLLKFAVSQAPEWERFSVEDFKNPALQSIFSSLEPLVRDGQTDRLVWQDRFPRLNQQIELLIFALENELSFNPDWNIEDYYRQVFGEFRVLATKQRMEDLTSRIRSAEQSGRGEEVKTLSGEFNILTQELAKLHVIQK